MREGRSLLLTLVMALTACVAAVAQDPVYNLGRTPTQEELQICCIPIGPEGKELPPGQGTAKEGAPIYAQKCAMCHGRTGKEAPFLHGRLVGGQGTLTTPSAIKTIGSFYPFATTVFDHIKRAMPQYSIPGDSQRCGSWEPAPPPGGGYGHCGTLDGVLSDSDVYALTALLLFWNDIIGENEVMNAKTLPKVQMPNRDGFLPPDPTKWSGTPQPHVVPKGSRP